MIELLDLKGDWWELRFGWYETQQRDKRDPLTVLWCSIGWGCDFRNQTGYDRIPIPVFTDFWR